MSYNIQLNPDQTAVDTRFAAFIAKCEAENDAISRRYEQEQEATLLAQVGTTVVLAVPCGGTFRGKIERVFDTERVVRWSDGPATRVRVADLRLAESRP